MGEFACQNKLLQYGSSLGSVLSQFLSAQGKREIQISWGLFSIFTRPTESRLKSLTTASGLCFVFLKSYF